MVHTKKIMKLHLNLSKLCLEILWLLFSRHGVYLRFNNNLNYAEKP